MVHNALKRQTTCGVVVAVEQVAGELEELQGAAVKYDVAVLRADWILRAVDKNSRALNYTTVP